jgi:uncharacterized glyoxalase superfamily protein PhnB
MNQRLITVALLVREYDEALAFFLGKLHFTLVEDTALSESKRWVVVKPEGIGGANILLAKAIGERQLRAVGNQSGGRVSFFLHTDNFERDYQNLLNQNVAIVRAPSNESYGKVAVFIDLYGNPWDLIGAVQERGRTD